MRVGVLTTSYPRFDGDPAGCFVAELARWLCRAGDQVEVLAPEPARRLPADPSSLEVRALRHGLGRSRLFYRAGAPDNLAAGGGAGLRAWAEIPPFLARLGAATLARARRWDAVLSHWLIPSALVAGLGARALPQVAIAHSSDVHLLARLGPLGGALCEAIATPRTRLVLTSESLRARFSAIPLGRRGRRLVEHALVQRMGIPERALDPPTPGEVRSLRTRHRIEDRPVVLCLGRLVPAKGLEDLLRAAAGLELVLVLAGEGPERPALEAAAARLRLDCRFLGEVRGTTKRAWLAAASILVLPSRTLSDGRRDSAPLALLEAMAAGLPAVTTEVGGNAELITDGESGLLVPERDPGRLRAAIVRLLGAPGLRRRIAERGRAIARAHTWERIGPRLRALLGA
jgi:glycosyltransferase involved in cell wall biosynthesis